MAHPIRVAEAPSGALTYAIPVPPEDLPAVPPGDLLAAWALARTAAAREQWGPPRRLIFAGTTEPTEIAIADPDAGCWAEAIDRAIGLGTLSGLAVCLRLLALVEVLGRTPALAPLFDVTADGIDLHPRLLAAAASLPLDGAARFDAVGLQQHLGREKYSLPKPLPSIL